jgi:hypothetical protein
MSLQPNPAITPGAYPGNGQAKLLRCGEQAYLFYQNNVAANSASVAVQLERIKAGTFYPFGASFEIAFSGAPGTFEVDIQTADQDIDGNYVSINLVTSGLNSNNVGRVELPLFWARYVRAKVISLTNPVTVSVLVTR